MKWYKYLFFSISVFVNYSGNAQYKLIKKAGCEAGRYWNYNTKPLTVDGVNKGLSGQKIDLDSFPTVFNSLPISIDLFEGYHFGYFVTFMDSFKNKYRNELNIGLNFNNLNISSYNGFRIIEAETFKNYFYRVYQKSSTISLSVENLFLIPNKSKKHVLIAGIGASIGKAYSSQFEFYGSGYYYSNNKIKQIRKNSSVASSQNSNLAQGFLLFGVRFTYHRGNTMEWVIKQGAFNYFGKSPFTTNGYNTLISNRFTWPLYSLN